LSTTVNTVVWVGLSGATYTHWVYPLGTPLNAQPGNYCFARHLGQGRWEPLYFGQTGDLSERFDYHHKMGCAKRNGATHIHAHVNNGGEQARLREEADLVNRYRPTCNG
jgi:hypothetical protein